MLLLVLLLLLLLVVVAVVLVLVFVLVSLLPLVLALVPGGGAAAACGRGGAWWAQHAHHSVSLRPIGNGMSGCMQSMPTQLGWPSSLSAAPAAVGEMVTGIVRGWKVGLEQGVLASLAAHRLWRANEATWHHRCPAMRL